VFPSDVFSTGTIRVGGFKRTGDKVVCGFNAGDIYVGGNGLYSESTTQPMFFWIYKSEPVFHATADFSIHGHNATCGVSLFDIETVTFNTHGHTISWTAKIGSNGREKLVKDGDGVFIMQPVAVNNGNSRLMPIEVKGGTFRQGNSQITGPIAVRGGATLEVASGVTAANAVTLDAGASLELSEGALVSGTISTPATGTATVKPHGDFSGLTGWKASATLGVLAADADVAALSLDATGITFPSRGWQAKLMRSNDSLDIVFSKSGMMVIVR